MYLPAALVGLFVSLAGGQSPDLSQYVLPSVSDTIPPLDRPLILLDR